MTRKKKKSSKTIAKLQRVRPNLPVPQVVPMCTKLWPQLVELVHVHPPYNIVERQTNFLAAVSHDQSEGKISQKSS